MSELFAKMRNLFDLCNNGVELLQNSNQLVRWLNDKNEKFHFVSQNSRWIFIGWRAGGGLLVGEVAEYVEGGLYFVFARCAVNQYLTDISELGEVDVTAHVFLVMVHQFD